MYWDWRCLNCDQPISAHDPWWQRVLRRIEDRLVLWTLQDWAKRRKRKARRAASDSGSHDARYRECQGCGMEWFEGDQYAPEKHLSTCPIGPSNGSNPSGDPNASG